MVRREASSSWSTSRISWPSGNDVLFRRRVGIAGAGALEGLPDGGEPAAHDDRRDHGRERRGAEGDPGEGQEQIVPGLPAALVGIAQVVQDHEVPRPPSGIEGEGADEDVVILVADDGEALRVGPGRLRAGEGGRHVAGGEAQLLSLAIADGEHPLVGGDALEQDAGLLGIVAGEEAADLVPHGIEDEAGSQLDVATRPLFHEGCRKGQHGQDDDGRHEHCDAAEAEDDPQNAKFLKMFGSFIGPVWHGAMQRDARSGVDGGPPEKCGLRPCYGFARPTFQA